MSKTTTRYISLYSLLILFHTLKHKVQYLRVIYFLNKENKFYFVETPNCFFFREPLNKCERIFFLFQHWVWCVKQNFYVVQNVRLGPQYNSTENRNMNKVWTVSSRAPFNAIGDECVLFRIYVIRKHSNKSLYVMNATFYHWKRQFPE